MLRCRSLLGVVRRELDLKEGNELAEEDSDVVAESKHLQTYCIDIRGDRCWEPYGTSSNSDAYSVQATSVQGAFRAWCDLRRGDMDCFPDDYIPCGELEAKIRIRPSLISYTDNEIEENFLFFKTAKIEYE